MHYIQIYMQDKIIEYKACILWNHIWIQNLVTAITEGVREVRNLDKLMVRETYLQNEKNKKFQIYRVKIK